MKGPNLIHYFMVVTCLREIGHCTWKTYSSVESREFTWIYV